MIKTFFIILGIYLCCVFISFLIPIISGYIPHILSTIQTNFGIDLENSILQTNHNHQSLLSIYGGGNTQTLVLETIKRIMTDPFDILIMVFFLSLAGSSLIYYLKHGENIDTQTNVVKEDVFVGFLISEPI